MVLLKIPQQDQVSSGPDWCYAYALPNDRATEFRRGLQSLRYGFRRPVDDSTHQEQRTSLG